MNQETLNLAIKLGEIIYQSQMFGVNRPEQGVVIACISLAEGKPLSQILREYHVVEGKLSERADAMLVKFLAAGGRHRIVTRTADEAAVELMFFWNGANGQESTSYLSRRTWDDMKGEPWIYGKDGRPKANWSSPHKRAQMLWARAISDGIRALAPHVISAPMVAEDPDLGDEPAAPALELAKVAPQVNLPEPAPALELTKEVAQVNLPEPSPEPSPAEALSIRDQLALALGDNAPAAVDWLIARKWIPENALASGDPLSFLSPERAQRIIEKTEAFMEKVNADKKQK